MIYKINQDINGNKILIVDEPSGFQLFIEQHLLWNNCDRSIVFKEIAWQDYLNRENKK